MLRISLFILLFCAAAITHAATNILVFGDSISASYGLPRGTGWVDLLQQRLERDGVDYKVINASLSGETTTGGRNRINIALAQHNPQIVILELGANDGLRGARVETIHANLAAMIADCRKRGARVLLVGMQLPPNYGKVYVEKFRTLYPNLARAQRVALVPFMYEGFATDRDAFQADGIHPNAAAQARLLENVWTVLKPMLRGPAKISG